MTFAATAKGETMAKEYIDREAAKERLRVWITDCVLAGENDEADCSHGCAKMGIL